jgi:competence protein ComFC
MKSQNWLTFSRRLKTRNDQIVELFRSLYDFIFPKLGLCIYCKSDTPHQFVCDACSETLKKLEAENPKPNMLSCYYYDSMVSDLIKSYKYNDNEYYYEYMSVQIAKLIVESNLTADIITFVPLHKRRNAQRGFNQSKVIAKKVAELIGISYACTLIRTVNTDQQAKLSEQMRKENVKNAFKYKYNENLFNKSVIIIDDVVSTGATLACCIDKLSSHGAKDITSITFAKSHYK